MKRQNLMKAIGALLIIAGLSTPAQAANVGKAIPSDLSAQDATGQNRNFANLKGKNGAVLVFYRSADW